MASQTLPEVPGTAVEFASPPCEPPPDDRLYRLSLAQYHAMAAAGVLSERDRVELLDGLLVAKMTKGSRHVGVVLLIDRALRALLGEDWHPRQEAPVGLPGPPGGRDSEPEPDLMVVRGTIRDYMGRHPAPGDVGLVVEVADSSLREDRRGLARYARAGIATAWLVNLIDGTVEVYARPGAEGYEEVTVYRAGDRVHLALDGRELGSVAVDDVLP